MYAIRSYYADLARIVERHEADLVVLGHPGLPLPHPLLKRSGVRSKVPCILTDPYDPYAVDDVAPDDAVV